MTFLPEIWHGKVSQRGASRVERARSALVRRLAAEPLTPDLTVGAAAPDDIPVVMCFWHRPERIGAVLEMMQRQQTSRGIRLIIWNNEPTNTAQLRDELLRMRPAGALKAVQLHASPDNVGGIGRFVAARQLWREGQRGPFIMIDDDEDVGPSAVQRFLDGWTPHSLLSWWAFATHGSYWNRSEIAPGDTADYAGTGGSIVDIEIASAPSFFEIPSRFLFVEDLWMDHWAKLHGWRVQKLDVDITQVMEYEHTNQYHSLRDRKDEFDAFLREREALSLSR